MIKSSLAEDFPELAKQWHREKNAELIPSDMPSQSHKKVWWLCEKGHEWPARIQNRSINQSKCPYCTNKKANTENCLQTTHHEIAKEWHPEKNGTVSPLDFTWGSMKKVWWLCKNGHEWQTTINHRTSKNNKCKSCKSLAFCNPELAKQWHPTLNDLTPNQVSEASSYKAWWKCDNGHEWQTRVGYRTRQKSNCQKCWYEKELVKTLRKARVQNVDSIADTHPWLVNEWHPTKNGIITPYNITQGSHQNTWWICNNGHKDYQMVLNHRTRKSSGRRNTAGNLHLGASGCPDCGLVVQGQKYVHLMIKKNGSLKEKFPHVAKEWHPDKNHELTPDAVTSKASRKVWWICKECNNEWQATIQNRTQKQSGCPECYKNLHHLNRRNIVPALQSKLS